MSEDQSSSGAPNNASGGDSKDTVAYDTYKKAVSEVKKLKEERDAFLRAQDEQKQQVMVEQQKYKELAEKLQKDLKEKEDAIKKKDAFFIQSNLKQTVSRFAKDMGAAEQAVDEVFVVAKTKGLLDSVTVGEDYSINTDQVKEALAELSKKSPWFFQKQAAPPKDVNMGGNSGGAGLKDLTKLSYDELIRLGKTAK